MEDKGRTRRGRRLFFFGIAAVAAATGLLLWFARDGRFDAGGVAIDPAPSVDGGRTYELIVWGEEMVIPWAGKTHSEIWMEGIRTFQTARPEAAVSYILMEPAEAQGRLAEALRAGTPPDVYGTARGVVHHDKLLVPASPYLKVSPELADPGGPVAPAPEAGLSAAATAMLSEGDRLWGWPTAIWWQAWIGRPDEAPFPPALDVSQPAVLEQWLVGRGAGLYTDGAGALTWREEDLLPLADSVERLRQDGRLPEAEPDPAAARTRVADLVTGRAPALGPAGPHLAQAVFRHSPGRFALVVAPPPGESDPDPDVPYPGPVLDVGGLFVFRQARYAGDDHTRLAAELAAHLAARTELWLVEALGLLPVRPEGYRLWETAAPLADGDRRRLTGWVEAGGAAMPWRTRRRVEELRAAIHPLWLAFWRGDADGETFAREAAAALAGLVAPP